MADYQEIVEILVEMRDQTPQGARQIADTIAQLQARVDSLGDVAPRLDFSAILRDSSAALERQIGLMGEAVTVAERLAEAHREIGRLGGATFGSNRAPLDIGANLLEGVPLLHRALGEVQQDLVLLREEALSAETAIGRLMSRNQGALTGDVLQPYRDETGTVPPVGAVEARAEIARLRDEAASGRYGKALEGGNEISIAAAEAAAMQAGLATEAAEAKSALADETAVAERQAAAFAAVTGETDALAVAQGRLAVAMLRVQELADNPLASERQLTAAVTSLRSTQATVDRLRAVAASPTAESEGTLASRFFSGFAGTGRHGAGAGQEHGLLDLADMTGAIARYTILFQLMHSALTVLRDSVTETVDFERAVSQLAYTFGQTRDSVQGIADTLGQISASAGLSPSAGVLFGAQYAAHFAGQGNPADLATIGATLGSQMAVVGGVDATQAQSQLGEATAVATAFNLNAQTGTQRILDAAASASRQYGIANPNDLFSGIGQIADVAQQGGFSPEQTVSIMADVMNRTGENASTAAGELRRFFGREGSSPFQKIFSEQGISTEQPFVGELSQLSQQYAKFSPGRQREIFSELGGGRAGAAAVAVLENFSKDTQNANTALNQGGAYAQTYAQRLGDLRGMLSQLHGLFLELAKDIGTSGLGTIFGVALEAAIPLLRTLADIIGEFNKLPAGLREIAFGGAEIAGLVYGARRVASAGLPNPAGMIGGVFGRGAAGEKVAVNVTDVANSPLATAGAVGALPVTSADAAAGAAGAAGVSTVELQAEFDSLQMQMAEVQALYADEQIELEAATAAMAELGTASAAAAAALDAMAVQAEVTAFANEAGAGMSLAGSLGIGSVGARIGAAGAGLWGALASPLGVAGLAIGGATIVDNAYNSTQSQETAKNAIDSFALTATTAKGLQAQQQQASQMAQTAQHSSSGLLGTITNALSAALGDLFPASYESTGTAAKAANQLKGLAGYEAGAITSAQNELPTATNNASNSALIDLATSARVDATLKLLSSRGLDAGQSLTALIGRLNDFALASDGAANMLVAGQYRVVAAQIGAASTNAFAKAQPDQARQLDLKSLSNAVTTSTSLDMGFLGLSQGGDITAADTSLIANAGIGGAENNLIQQAMSQGMTHAQAARYVQGLKGDISLAVRQSTRQQVGDVNALRGQKLAPGIVGSVEKDAGTLITNAGTEAQNAARVTASGMGAMSPEAAAVVGAHAALTAAQSIYSALKKSVHSASELKTMDHEIQQLQANVLTTTQQNLQALGQLAAAQAGPFNQMGNIQAQIAATQAQLKTAPHDTQLQTQLAQESNNRTTQADAQAQSQILAGVDPFSSVSAAMAQYSAATKHFNDVVASGAPKNSKEYNDALTAQKQAYAAAARANEQDAAAAIQAQVAIGDTAGAALAQYKSLIGQASLTDDAGARAQILQQAGQSYLAYLKGLVSEATVAASLSTDMTDPFYAAINALQKAQGNLNADLEMNAKNPGSVSGAQINTDKATATAAQWAKQKAGFDDLMQQQQALFDSRRESAATYIQGLEKEQKVLQGLLHGMHAGQQGYKQLQNELNSVDQQILNTQLANGGQWNIGNIKLPTPYEARREVQAQSQHVNYQDNTVVTINVNGADTAQVKTLLSSLVGPQAQYPRSGTLGRKVYT